MNYLHLEKLTPGNLAAFAVAIALAWFLYKGTKHLFFGLFCLTVAVVGVGYLTGVITTDDTKAVLAAAKKAGQEGLNAADLRAKALGGGEYDPAVDKRATLENAYKNPTNK